MKIQRVLALTKKEMKKTIREPAVLFMIFLFPIVFVFAFGSAFSGGSGQPTYNVGIVNTDRESPVNASQTLIAAMSSTKILNLQMYADNNTAQSSLSQGSIQAVMVISEDFSESFASYIAAPDNPSTWKNATVALYLDKGSLVATQAIPPIIQQILQSMTNQNQQAPMSARTPFHLDIASLEVKVPSALDFIAPGMFTFASIFLIMMVAQSFTQDRENGMMKRIRITPTTAMEFMSSQVVSYMIIALIQAALVFVMMYMMGFRPQVGILVYAFAFILVLLFSLSNVGFGLITATVAKTSGAATGLSFLFVLPQLFLGTFVGASLSSGAQIVGKFVPSYYVTDALTSLFLRGAAITSVTILLDTTIVSVFCVAILAIGIVLYGKYFRI
ncbi:MAG TPA: ABC transporter permease [Candidatus Sulfotelmatobacter sp.]|nr:ABC transporter permease [Candidatus Sulfotelmatobacter sp.]